MKKTITVNYPIEKVYNYLQDLGNILKVTKNTKVEVKGPHEAIVKIPVYGDIRMVITNPLIRNEYIKVVAQKIGTTVEISLSSTPEGKTDVTVNTECNPTGLFKSVVRGYIEKGFNRFPEYLMKIDFNE